MRLNLVPTLLIWTAAAAAVVAREAAKNTSSASYEDEDYFANLPDDSLFPAAGNFDTDEAPLIGKLFTHFLPDSQDQLVLDLDLLRQIVDAHRKFGASTSVGDGEAARWLLKAAAWLRRYDVSAACLADLFHYAWTAFEYATHVSEAKRCAPEQNCTCTPQHLQQRSEKNWIFNVLDAIGKVPAGVLGGNNLWVGSWSTCRKISVLKNYQGQKWQGQYCMVRLYSYTRNTKVFNIEAGAPDKHCWLDPNATHEGQSTVDDEEDDSCFDVIPMLNLGLCAPATCTNYDVNRIVNFTTQLVESAVGRSVVCSASVECKNEEARQKVTGQPLYTVAVYATVFVVVAMAFGTLYDVLVFEPDKPEITELAPAARKTRREEAHWLVRMLVAFSVRENGRALLKTAKGDGQIDAIHGVRFLSMAWIILGHTYYYIGTSLTTDNLIPTLRDFPQQFYTQVIVQAPLAVDSFFLLSGLLCSFMTLKKIAQRAFHIDRPIMWLMFVVRRLTRLYPLYIAVMVLDVTLFANASDGPFWRPIEPLGCRYTWWTNLIYMNNFLYQDVECCMGWTWYLANDVQFHVVLAPLLVVGFHKFGSRCLILAIGLILGSQLLQWYLMVVNDFPPAPLLTTNLDIVKKLSAYWSDMYVKPYVRCCPYIVGIIVGYMLYKELLEKNNNTTAGNHNATRVRGRVDSTTELRIRVAWAVGWITAAVLGLYSIFGLWTYASTGEISEVWRVGYALFGRPAYSVSLAWVIYACATKRAPMLNAFLGWRAFLPLSRMTFAAYLIHPILLQIYNFSRPQPFHFTTLYQMLSLVFVAVIVSYAAGCALALAIELPCATFESWLFEAKPKRRQSSKRPPSRPLVANVQNVADGEKNGDIELDERSTSARAVVVEGNGREKL